MTSPGADQAIWRVLGDPLLSGAAAGALVGETVAVKDLFAVAGFATGAGVPDYLSSQPPQRVHAVAVQQLLDAGAALRGIAQTDQLAYSLTGDNEHYGTPPNVAAPGALPGGSSSGCATAVASGQASIGLGTDTAGSIRIPASYQGLWGWRPTHGAISTDGVVPLVPDYDTVGLLTRTPELLARAAGVLLDEPDTTAVEEARPLDLTGLPGRGIDLAAISEAARIHGAFQAWQQHGAWITAHPGAVRGSAAARFEFAAHVTAASDEAAQAVLSDARARLDDILSDRIVSIPTAPGAAPRLDAPPTAVQRVREQTLLLTYVAVVTGRPAVCAPLRRTADGPVGTSFIGPRGSDLTVIRAAASACTSAA